MAYEHLIVKPFIKSAKELVHHREGQGIRYVFLDERIINETSLYTIVRKVDNLQEDEISHVDAHAHNCDSAFLFIGNKENLEGLISEVTLEDEKYLIKSPASVFIPKGLKHSYRFIEGSGYYTNIVLSSNYNNTII